MTTWANAVASSCSAESFHGDIFMLSCWYNIFS